MDAKPSHSSRIAYSFPEGTFDLQRLCPAHAFEADGGTAVAVQMDGRWPKFFRELQHVGLIMATAASGPISLAAAWDRPVFHAYPGSSEWISLELGAEILPSAFGGALAVVEEAGGQQLASFQFFDRQGEGCLKLLITHGSDLDAFEALVTQHACPRQTRSFGQKRKDVPESVAPESVVVRQLWNGLTRSLPDSQFPGLSGVSRQEALEVVGEDLAWRLSRRVVRQALQSMTLNGVPLGAAIRNAAVFLPAGFFPTHWAQCNCGVTFFGEASQLTLRGCHSDGQAWATRFTRGGESVVCVEQYDACGQFCAGVGVRPEAVASQHGQWADLLKMEGGVLEG